jgi:hypothetical protein
MRRFRHERGFVFVDDAAACRYRPRWETARLRPPRRSCGIEVHGVESPSRRPSGPAVLFGSTYPLISRCGDQLAELRCRRIARSSRPRRSDAPDLGYSMAPMSAPPRSTWIPSCCGHQWALHRSEALRYWQRVRGVSRGTRAQADSTSRVARQGARCRRRAKAGPRSSPMNAAALLATSWTSAEVRDDGRRAGAGIIGRSRRCVTDPADRAPPGFAGPGGGGRRGSIGRSPMRSRLRRNPGPPGDREEPATSPLGVLLEVNHPAQGFLNRLIA